MRRLIAFVLVLTLLPVSITFAQQSPLSAVVMGSATVQNVDGSSTRWSGGLQVGFETPIDQSAGLSGRVLYTKWQFGDPTLETIRTSAKWRWYVGPKLGFYLLAGGDAWIGGEQSGLDLMTGCGMDWRVYTAKGDEWLVPFSISVLFEVVFADAENPLNNTGQLNLGLSFARPVGK